MRIAYDKRGAVQSTRYARAVRRALRERGTVALNLIGSPGSGRTSLIERTAPWCRSSGVAAGALVGSPARRDDADRLEAAGLPAIPIVTGGKCHLRAESVLNRLGDEELFGARLLLIENVGDLICPAAYDLGENAKIAFLSVPEGDDKPLKYPSLFERADLVLVTKIDLLGLSDFDVARAVRNAHEVAPGRPVLPISSRTGEGLPLWFDWIDETLRSASPARRSERRTASERRPAPAVEPPP